MNLNDIHIAIVVGREQSVSLAAVHLGIAPGTVSKAISRLEQQTKVQLFERLARGMRPTEIGETFLQRAQGMDLAAEDLYLQMRDLRQARAGTLRIGVGHGIPDRFVLPVVGQLVERGINVQISGGMTDSLRREVAVGEQDFAVIGLFQEPSDGLAWESHAYDPMVPMAPKGHPMADTPRPVAWKDLTQTRWIVTGRQTSTFTEYERNFAAHGLKAPQPAILSQSSLREVALALTTKSVVLMPRSMTTEAKSVKLLPVRPAGGWHSDRYVGLATREGGYVGPAAELALKLFREIFKKFD